MIMNYFSGLRESIHNNLPQCRAWIDREFPYCAINYAHSGRIWWAMHNEPLRVLTAPVAWWTVPNIRYVYGNFEGESWHHYYVTFQGPRVKKIVEGNLLVSNPQSLHYCSIRDAARFRQTMEALQLVLGQHSIQSARATLLLEDLLLQLHEQQAANAPSMPWEQEICALMQRITAAPQKTWDVEQIADGLGVSTVHLRRVFKRVSGMPLQQFVIKSRIDSAAHDLRLTRDPITTIAYRNGFCDLHYFSKLFKKHYGFTPSVYRRETQLL
jgi:AraC-like DNA-binding protein